MIYIARISRIESEALNNNINSTSISTAQNKLCSVALTKFKQIFLVSWYYYY